MLLGHLVDEHISAKRGERYRRVLGDLEPDLVHGSFLSASFPLSKLFPSADVAA
jgi:hypothetical protein